MNISIIKKFERCGLTAYQDNSGVIRIGYGCRTYPNGKAVRLGDRIPSRDEAENLLANVIQALLIPRLNKIPTWQFMNGDQQGAIASFAHDLNPGFFGADGFSSITQLLMYPVIWQDGKEIERVFCQYKKPKRRAAEAQLFVRYT